MLMTGDCREILAKLPAGHVQTVITSPPYFGLRDYMTGKWEGGDPDCDHQHHTSHQKQGATSQRAGRSNTEAQRNENFHNVCAKCGAERVDAQIGLEETVDDYVAGMVGVMRGVRRVLRDDGTVWLNIGDSYVGAGGSRGSGGRGPSSGKQVTNAGSYFKQPPKPRTKLPAKNLFGVPWRLAFALQDDGWILRSDIIWAKPNPMPESVRDRPTRAHEYVFLLAKRPKYKYDADAIKTPLAESTIKETKEGYTGKATKDFESAKAQDASATKTRIIENLRKKQDQLGHRRYTGFNDRWDNEGGQARVIAKAGANRRSVWQITPQPFRGAHFAVFPEALVELCVKAGSAPGDLVLDPFAGSGTTGVVCKKLDRKFLGIDLNPEFAAMAEKRIGAVEV